jgi:hypothetical protein
MADHYPNTDLIDLIAAYFHCPEREADRAYALEKFQIGLSIDAKLRRIFELVPRRLVLDITIGLLRDPEALVGSGRVPLPTALAVHYHLVEGITFTSLAPEPLYPTLVWLQGRLQNHLSTIPPDEFLDIANKILMQGIDSALDSTPLANVLAASLALHQGITLRVPEPQPIVAAFHNPPDPKTWRSQ